VRWGRYGGADAGRAFREAELHMFDGDRDQRIDAVGGLDETPDGGSEDC
jgi:hypothetical protein